MLLKNDTGNECTGSGVVAIIPLEYYFMCMGMLLPCVLVHHICAVSKEAREGT